MSRLEEIRESLKNAVAYNDSCISDYYYDDTLGDKVVTLAGHIEYLLNEVERLKEALRKISVPMPGSRDNELVLYYERIAQEALQQKEPAPE